MSEQQNIDCSDLFESAANELRTLESKKEDIIKQLAKDVEARGVPKDRVVRTVVKELDRRNYYGSRKHFLRTKFYCG